MASASIKEIKNRIRSIQSTRQITRAMELVAASKLKKAQARIDASRPYFRIIYGMLQDILSQNAERALPYLAPAGTEGRPAYVVIAGDRGSRAATTPPCSKTRSGAWKTKIRSFCPSAGAPRSFLRTDPSK